MLGAGCLEQQKGSQRARKQSSWRAEHGVGNTWPGKACCGPETPAEGRARREGGKQRSRGGVGSRARAGNSGRAPAEPGEVSGDRPWGFLSEECSPLREESGRTEERLLRSGEEAEISTGESGSGKRWCEKQESLSSRLGTRNQRWPHPDTHLSTSPRLPQASNGVTFVSVHCVSH